MSARCGGCDAWLWFAENSAAQAALGRVRELADAATDFDEIGEGWVSVRALRTALDGECA